MKKIFPYIPENHGKYGKKVCRDLIDMVIIWKNNGKFGKILKVRFFPGFLPEFCHCTFAMWREIFTILSILPQKTHRKKICPIGRRER